MDWFYGAGSSDWLIFLNSFDVFVTGASDCDGHRWKDWTGRERQDLPLLGRSISSILAGSISLLPASNGFLVEASLFYQRPMDPINATRRVDEIFAYPIKYYSSISSGLRETKTAIWVQGSISYRGYGSVKSTVLLLNFSHIIQLDILCPSSRENHH